MKKVKQLAIIILMITILMILSIKAEAVIENGIEIKEDEQYTLAEETEVKAVPVISSRTKATISGNIRIIEIINDWCRIESDTEIGWIRINLLKKSMVAKTQEQEQEPQPEENIPPENTSDIDNSPKEEEKKPTVTEIKKTGYVNADGLVVREKPTTSSEELDSLSRNHKLEIIGEVDGWYKIKLNGEIGYVSAKYVSDKKTTETTSRGGNSIKPDDITPMEEPKKEEEQSNNKTENTSGTTGAAVVEYAKKYLGYKYVSGGTSPEKGFDCSGYTSYVYKHFGISLNRSSKGQINNGVAVERSNLQPGDLVIFNNSGNTAIGHVGIYIGGDNFIHAANAKEGVKITSLSSSYYKPRYVGARRVI